MNRRRFLQSSGCTVLLGGLAGCLDRFQYTELDDFSYSFERNPTLPDQILGDYELEDETHYADFMIDYNKLLVGGYFPVGSSTCNAAGLGDISYDDYDFSISVISEEETPTNDGDSVECTDDINTERFLVTIEPESDTDISNTFRDVQVSLIDYSGETEEFSL